MAAVATGDSDGSCDSPRKLIPKAKSECATSPYMVFGLMLSSGFLACCAAGINVQEIDLG